MLIAYMLNQENFAANVFLFGLQLDKSDVPDFC